MVSFTKKEQIAILIIVLIIASFLGYQFIIKDLGLIFPLCWGEHSFFGHVCYPKCHQNCEHHQVIHNCHLMGDTGSDYHEYTAEDSQTRHHKTLEGRKVFFTLHHHQKNRDVTRVKRDDGQFRGIKSDRSKPGGCQVGAVKV